MRTLNEIIEACKGNTPVTTEECMYAVCALEALSSIDRGSMMEMWEAAENNHEIYLMNRCEESIEMWKRALAISPRDWIGWNNDPSNTEYQERREMFNKIVSSHFKWVATE